MWIWTLDLDMTLVEKHPQKVTVLHPAHDMMEEKALTVKKRRTEVCSPWVKALGRVATELRGGGRKWVLSVQIRGSSPSVNVIIGVWRGSTVCRPLTLDLAPYVVLRPWLGVLGNGTVEWGVCCLRENMAVPCLPNFQAAGPHHMI